MTLEGLVILGLAAWRLAFLITQEDGPFNVFYRLRQRFPEDGHGRIGDLLNCVYCMSVWTALVCVWLWRTELQVLVWVLAASGGALLVEWVHGIGERLG